ncbi:Bifunctional polyhydroxybutyrate synthase / ABC transporter periplasmic binding protein [uncultured bacterium]|nr:Bifunctional polyhydroxybutyrate synthase / ABC transporter periplasmic binding protein [uncultured bacterium]
MEITHSRSGSLLAAVALGAAIAAPSLARAEGNLTLLVWEGYADKTFVEPFQDQTKCQVKAVYVGSNDEIVSKVMTGSGAADIISPSSDTVKRLIAADAVAPIDPAKVPNMKDFLPQFQNPSWGTVDGKLYGVSYGWGITRIIANATAVDPETDSLAFLWDSKFAGKIAVWDDIETLYMTSRYLGFKNTYDLSDEQLEQVKQKLIEMKPNVRKYWFTTGEMTTLMAGREVVAGNAWETTYTELKSKDKNIVEIVPKEGRGGWADALMIVKGAEDNPCVYAWLNYVSSPKAQAIAHKVTGFGYSNAKMSAELDAQERATYQALGMDDASKLTDIDWWQPTKRRAKYLEIWNQVKAAP